MLFVLLTLAFTWPLASNPGGLLGGTNDPPLFTWILATVAQSLMNDPLSLFDGSLFEGGIFYPYGRAISFSEPLIFPALVSGAPAYSFSGNPIFAYNLSLIIFQALSGWAAWFAVYRITGSGAGAVLAGIVFAFSAYKMGYYNFLNIHLSFAVPLAIVSFIAFLESCHLKPLLITIFLITIQAASIWYGAVPLGLVLGLLLIVYVFMRPGLWIVNAGWRLALGALLLAAMVAPVALPYFRTHAEMAFVRELSEVNKFRADLLSFLDPGVNSYWPRWVDSGREPGLSVGYICLALAMFAGLFALVRVIKRAQGKTRWLMIAVLGAGGAIFFALCQRIVATYQRTATGLAEVEFAPDDLLLLIAGLLSTLLIFFLVVGLSWRRGRSTRSVRLEEWVLVACGFVFIGALLVLGPEVHINEQSAGTGLYSFLYANIPGFNGLRIAIRLAFVYLFFVGLLAAFGIRILSLTLNRRRAKLLWLLPVLAVVELWPGAIDYQAFDWQHPPPVYQQLAETDDPGVVLELPTFDENIDSTYMLWSLKHAAPIVNGVSGFYPPHIQKLATLTQSLPRRPNLEPLEQIHGLKSLVVHLDAIKQPKLVSSWEKLSQSPPAGLRFIERFDDALLFELKRTPVPAWRWRRLLPSATAKSLGTVSLDIELPAPEQTSTAPPPEIEHEIELKLNGVVRNQFQLTPGSNSVVTPLPEITSLVHPVALEIHQSYNITADTNGDSRYRLGNSAQFSKADIVVESASRSYGSFATIWVNGINHSPRQPGYNVVILDSENGSLLGRAAFNVEKDPRQFAAMKKFIENTAIGSIVIISLKGNAGIDTDQSLRAVGLLIGANPGGRDDAEVTASHLIIGIRGASPGHAVEIVDESLITHTIGVDRRNLGMTVSRFELQP